MMHVILLAFRIGFNPFNTSVSTFSWFEMKQHGFSSHCMLQDSCNTLPNKKLSNQTTTVDDRLIAQIIIETIYYLNTLHEIQPQERYVRLCLRYGFTVQQLRAFRKLQPSKHLPIQS